MGTSRNLTSAAWRKSTYSGDSGGDCVECATLGDTAWRKSSYSGSSGGDCVEVAACPAAVAVRDSKDPDGPAFAVPAAAFAAFVAAAADGEFNS
ncbi:MULTISPECIES: DUF397 domain-containing protein [unclassified Streptomyces]|uniref:DUF397 domain-containing protein n=1 Tax=unclassified Streptomyces TaxID=2593676 RepID=UPI002DD9BB77|nr:DUF397 domain-containing protein [Streptomyces sp. NBC_01750]WSB02801.1 DUF397 domain-containing protein [Streptomyces sp. NBC_01794]WSD32926.1 DUF397 domain-containing protein [Streptomyces sp. NBC_01750]